MKVSELPEYQSKYLRADDLPRPVEATIQAVLLETMYDRREKDTIQRLVLAFTGKRKLLVLNKTRAAAMVVLAGDETDNWPGVVVRLLPTTQAGKPTIAIEAAA